MNVSQGSKTMCLDFEKKVKSWEVIHDTLKTMFSAKLKWPYCEK